MKWIQYGLTGSSENVPEDAILDVLQRQMGRGKGHCEVFEALCTMRYTPPSACLGTQHVPNECGRYVRYRSRQPMVGCRSTPTSSKLVYCMSFGEHQPSQVARDTPTMQPSPAYTDIGRESLSSHRPPIGRCPT